MAIFILAITVYLSLQKSGKTENYSTKSDSKLYELVIQSKPGDRVDLYKYVEWNFSNQGEEIFHAEEVDSNGQLKIKLTEGKYTIFARCIKMSCQKGFVGPKVIKLNENKNVKLEWSSQY